MNITTSTHAPRCYAVALYSRRRWRVVIGPGRTAEAPTLGEALALAGVAL